MMLAHCSPALDVLTSSGWYLAVVLESLGITAVPTLDVWDVISSLFTSFFS